jgi:hypothetical protein
MTSSETEQTTPAETGAGARQDSPAETVVVADFTVTDWQQTDEGDRARAQVSKTFTGALEGTSLAELIMAGGETGRGYIAHEVFTGILDGRRGTIVFQHGGIDDGVAPFSYGYVVPGTGTDELTGLKGRITYAHDEAGARVRLVLSS